MKLSGGGVAKITGKEGETFTVSGIICFLNSKEILSTYLIHRKIGNCSGL